MYTFNETPVFDATDCWALAILATIYNIGCALYLVRVVQRMDGGWCSLAGLSALAPVMSRPALQFAVWLLIAAWAAAMGWWSLLINPLLLVLIYAPAGVLLAHKAHAYRSRIIPFPTSPFSNN